MSTGNTTVKTQTTISYDNKSFIINGERKFLNSAAIHYFRMPKEEWRGLLVKAKLAGINCIDTYFAWNVHEPNEGVWNFEGDADCGAFLDLCHELGLWVMARPGPYICAEWDFGGFPWWLNNKPGIRFREYNDVYLHYVDLYMDRIAEVLQSRQITSGGPVILVQVENEFGYLADDETGSKYLGHLRDGLLNRGIDVPLITCVGGVEGAIEGANFWSGADQHYANLVNKQPDTPKVVTEFWTGWFEHWGAAAAVQKTPQLYEKRMMEVLQAGFSGMSHYMFYGGTNFGGYGGRTVGASDIFMVTSYDYDAPLNEYGRTTPKYRAAKRLAYFIHAIESFLLESEPLDVEGIKASAGIQLRGRRLADQRLLFVESKREEREIFHITMEDGRTVPVMVNPGEIVPVLDRLELGNGLRLSCNTWIAGNENIDGVRTILVFARQGQRSIVELTGEVDIGFVGEVPPLLFTKSPDGRTIRLDLYHFHEQTSMRLSVGDELVELRILNTGEMDRTWRLEAGRWISGCADLDLAVDGELYGCRGSSNRGQELRAPTLLGWESMGLDLGAVVGSAVAKPVDFSGYTQPFGYLLYSTSIHSDTDRSTMLVLPKLQDTARVYLNGSEVGLIREVGSAYIEIHLRQGENRLQILVQNMGRLNFSPFLGEPKGLFDTGYLNGAVTDLRKGWMAEGQPINLDEVNQLEGQPMLSRTFRLEGHNRAVLVGAISVPLKINGKEVALDGYRSWFANGTVDISEYVTEGDNLVEMEYYKSPLSRLELLAYHSSEGIGEWSMTGLEQEKPMQAQATRETWGLGIPSWHSCKFAGPVVADSEHVRLKLRLTGMSKGTLWLNGVNLGRYWQIGPQEDYKLPMAWLKDINELVLFDEEGRSPCSVRLLFDEESFLQWERMGG